MSIRASKCDKILPQQYLGMPKGEEMVVNSEEELLLENGEQPPAGAL